MKWESVCVRNNAWLKRSNLRRSWETKKKTKVPEQRKWRCVKTTHKSSGFLLTGNSQTADDIITKEPYKRSSYSLQSQFNSPWMVIGNSRGNQSYCTFFCSPWRFIWQKRPFEYLWALRSSFNSGLTESIIIKNLTVVTLHSWSSILSVQKLKEFSGFS